MSRYNHTRYQSSDRQSEARSYSPARYNAPNNLPSDNSTASPQSAEKITFKNTAPLNPSAAKPLSQSTNQPPGKLIQDAFAVKQTEPSQQSNATKTSSKPVPKKSSVLHRSSVEKPYNPHDSFRDYIDTSKAKKNSLVRWRFIGASIAVLIVVSGIGSLAAVWLHSMPDESKNRDVLSEQIARTSGMQTEHSAYVSEEPISESDKKNHQVADNEPKRVFVEHVDIDARVHRAGVNRHNQLIMPSNVHDVNWYEGSRAPGNRGAVLLSGYVSGPTERGALYYTRALEHGDIIVVENGDGTTREYEVVQREFVAYDEVDVYSLLVPYERGKNTLHILAADNRYNVMNNGFQDRLIIYAVER